jgi:hypothetical protein
MVHKMLEYQTIRTQTTLLGVYGPKQQISLRAWLRITLYKRLSPLEDSGKNI